MSSYLFGLIADASRIFGEFNAGNPEESSANFSVLDEDDGRLCVNEGIFFERNCGFLD